MATPGAIQLAQRLRGLREKARLTQSELAELFTTDGRSATGAAVSSWERSRDPSPLPDYRAEPYARLAALQGKPTRLPPIEELSDAQQDIRLETLDELLSLIEQARGGPAAADLARAASHRSWFFTEGPVVIVVPDAGKGAVGPLVETTNPNFTTLHRLADLDALIELHGHIRAENDPALPVFFKPASEVKSDDLLGHLVLLGGTGWNPITARLLKLLNRLPVRQIEIPELDSGEIFAVGHGKEERRFTPIWSTQDGDDTRVLEMDVALLARVVNPFNSSRSLTLCNGVHSRGVLGAVRTLTDALVRDANEAFIARRFPQGEYGLLIKVPVLRGQALSPDLQHPDNILYAWPEPSPSKPRRNR